MQTETKPRRNSSIELLRIVAMFFITIHHNLIYGIGACGYGEAAKDIPYNGTIPLIDDILNGMCVVGVNLFIIITGWFGIRSVKDSLLRLLDAYIICVCFFAIERNTFSSSTWDMGGWWFLPEFTILVLLSPIIENSIKGISRNKFLWFLFLLTIVNELFGYCWMHSNPSGYNFLNFVYLYYIARFLRVRYDDKDRIILFMSRYGLLLFLCCAVFLGAFHAYRYQTTGYGSRLWAYNNPIVIIEAFCLFLWFASLKLSNKWINFLAGGTFIIYLITGKGADDLHIYQNALISFQKYSYFGMIMYSLIFCAILYLPCSITIYLFKKLSKVVRQHFYDAWNTLNNKYLKNG